MPDADAPPPQDPLARGLGYASVGLGVLPLLLPGRVATAIGARDDLRSRSVLRAVGVQELLVAAGILKLRPQRPAGMLWARVGGDVLHAGLLGRTLRSRRRRVSAVRLTGTLATIAAIGAADFVAARRATAA